MTSTVAIEANTSDGPVSFGLVELDLLATHAGAPVPFPLRVPAFGRIAGERQVLFAAAGRALRAHGLADDLGPIGIAADLVAALRDHRGTVDLVLTNAEQTLAVVAMVHQSWALLCRQHLTGEHGGTVLVRRVTETALADHLLAEIPELSSARSMPVSLPATVANGAARLVETVEPTELADRLRHLVADCGGDPRALDELVGLLPAVTGRGQLGATRRVAGRSTRTGSELSWLDSPRGRARVNHGEDGWLSVNPLHHKEIAFALADLAAIARERR